MFEKTNFKSSSFILTKNFYMKKSLFRIFVILLIFCFSGFSASSLKSQENKQYLPMTCLTSTVLTPCGWFRITSCCNGCYLYDLQYLNDQTADLLCGSQGPM